MDQVVIDASVFVKLLEDEEDSNRSYELRDAYIARKIKILVPSVFHYEVLNAFKYSKGYEVKELESIAEILENYGFNILSFSPDFAKLIAMYATKYDISVYDASYVALAKMTESVFYTADEKLIKMVRSPLIKHIKDFK